MYSLVDIVISIGWCDVGPTRNALRYKERYRLGATQPILPDTGQADDPDQPVVFQDVNPDPCPRARARIDTSRNVPW